MLTINITKLPWRNQKPKHFFWGHFLVSPALHPGFSGLRPPPALSSTPTLCFFFCECLGIQFFNSLTCDLGDTMPRQRSLTLFTHMWLTGRYATPEVTHTLFPTQPFLPWVLRIWESVFYLGLLIPREAEDFSRGDRHFKHVPSPTNLICLSPKESYTVGSI